MATVKEQLKLLNEVRQRLAVWEAIVSWLDDNFIGKEGRPPTKAIRPKDCLVDVVSEDIVEEILQEIGEGKIVQLTQQIDDVENGEIVVIKGGKDEQQSQN